MSFLFLILTILSPIHWSGVEKGDSVELTVTVDDGWHLTLISIGDSAVGEDFSSGAVFRVAQGTEMRYVACDDQQCLSPEVYIYGSKEQGRPLPTSPHWGGNVGTGNREQGTRNKEQGQAKDNKQSAIAQRAISQQSAISNSPQGEQSPLWHIFLLGLLGGLLAIFTPCVWPIIPMTVSFFMRQGGGKRSAVLYGLSILVIYVGLGLLVTVVFGASALNSLATNAILNLFFFVLLVVFALSFFGLFEITLPSSWSTRLDNRARSTTGVISILLMAFTLVIVSFSCTGPIIGTLLVEAASASAGTEQLLSPSVGMLGFAVALALPFALFAMFPHWIQGLPKSGTWMQMFKVSLAYLELALSLKFLSVADLAYGWGILPRWLFFLLWGGCFVAMAIHLSIILFRHRSSLFTTIVVSVLILLSLAFGVYSLTGIGGAPVRAVAAFAPPMKVEGREVFHDYETGMAYARQENRSVLLEFSGYGCVNCRKMEATVLVDETVRQRLQQFVLITLYVDDRRDADGDSIPDGDVWSRLQRERFGSNAQPYFVQLSPDGELLAEPYAFSTDVSSFLRWLQ